MSKEIAITDRAFEKALNRHGYGFQFAVLRAIQDAPTLSGLWVPRVSEFPVQVQGDATRIDFIMERLSHFKYPLYLICECKRVNPALSEWCFVKAPFVIQRYAPKQAVVVESLVKSYVAVHDEERPRGAPRAVPLNVMLYHVGFEAKSQKKGDPKGGKGDAIESAVTQVLRGTNGYLTTLEANPSLMEGDRRLDLLPVVFTTANLWVSDVDLYSSDLATGDVKLGNDNAQRVGWLWYQYHMSPGLKHSFPLLPHKGHRKLEEFMESQYVRTVAIVSAGGIEDFLIKLSVMEF